MIAVDNMAKVFISHSSADKELVDLFKNIILNAGLGIADEDIAYTSAVETGVPTGGNIPQYIKDNLTDCDIVFFMISENYRKSEVCLNEMGAAWALDKNVKPILLYDVPFTSVGWLYSMNLCARIDDEERLDALHDEICKVYGYNIGTLVWNRNRNYFLECIKNTIENTETTIPIKGFLEYTIEFSDNQEAYNTALDELNHLCDLYIAQQLNPLNEEFRKVQTDILCQKDYLKKVIPILENFVDSLCPCVETFVSRTKKMVNCIICIYTYPTISGSDKQRCKYVMANFLESFDHTRNTTITCRRSFMEYQDFESHQIIAKNKIIECLSKIIETVDDCINKINSTIY